MKSIQLHFVIFLLITSLLQGSDQICPSPLPRKYQHLQAGDVVSAYFGNWDVYGVNQYQIERVEDIADQLTHLIYGFMKPDDVTGVCRPHDIWADIGAFDDFQSKIGGNFAKLIDLKKKFPHLKILLSVGGGTYNKNFIALAQDTNRLHKFAKSCVDMLDFYNHPFRLDDNLRRVNHLTYEGLFDGLDLDWEWDTNSLTPELSQAYTQFIQELRRLLDLREDHLKKESILTVALQVNPKIYNNLNLAQIARDVNWFNIMAYDFFGPSNATIGFNAPICGEWSVYSIDGALQRIMTCGVSPAKMVLGLPFYGYLYENTDGHNAAITKDTKVKTIAYHVIESKYLHDASYKKIWNKYEEIPSLYSKKDRTFITYDNKESLIKKVQIAKNKRMQGVVLWRLSCDDAQHSMINAVAHAMR
ncbi:MAG: glycoside hydrolase family 18 protein [Candidatus Dependentiae bacterium]|nr:glycoside hydrolase family 18 protein [Candidatus Dependentiae bacterium]